MSGSRLLVASTRLPVSMSRAEDGSWRAQESPGGLATALRAVAVNREFTWVGWPGAAIAGQEQSQVRELLAEHGAVPVFIDADEHEGFYDHFSNRVLWPLFHNLGQPQSFEHKAWDDYRAVNQRFADTIIELAQPGDLVWVHDYQLALVPRMLRERGADCTIGYFLHIPFPSSETYRTLPVREAILRGILGSDLIGFHAYEYVSHFRSAALRVLGVESEPDHAVMPSHRANLEVLPIGIEPTQIAEAKQQPEVKRELQELRRQYRGKRVILGVDRLDYTKGLPQKLLAFEELLERHPELRGKATLIQVASPSRMQVEEYQSLKREIDELVGRINGKYAALDSTPPLVYINQHVQRDRLNALYELADVALVTPIRDGMNMVSLEYIAARGDEPGSLILSEFAGAATCLSGARLINPHNPSQIADALHEALTSEPSKSAWQHMREFVERNTSLRWAETFIDRMEEIGSQTTGPLVRRLRLDRDDETLSRARGAKRPLLLLDYDGTLTPHTAVPENAVPSPAVRAMIERIADVATVYVISGRPATFLDQNLGDLPIGLVCEHGLATKSIGGDWTRRAQLDSRAIDEIVLPIFEAFTERTPGSRIEHKASSIAWHYRNCDPKFGVWRAKELRSLVEDGLTGQPYTVLWGLRVLEVRHVEITKGHAATALLERHEDADFILCAGNDRTDEDMFHAVVDSGRGPSIVVHVGSVNTSAEFFVEDTDQLVAQLGSLVNLWESGK